MALTMTDGKDVVYQEGHRMEKNPDGAYTEELEVSVDGRKPQKFDVEIPEKETEETEVEPEQEVNEAEQRQKELKEIIEEYNQQKQDPDYYYLPDQWDGQKLTWQKSGDRTGSLLASLAFFAAFVVMLKKAKEGHYAVGQFNINNLEWTKAILATAQEMNSPVILGVSEGAGKYMTGFKTVAQMVKAMIEEMNITVPVALHLDHGTYDGCYKCIKAGFSSIMFDGSHYAIEENVEKTKELVKVAHAMGLSIEAEVGSIGGEEDGVIGMGECADPNECKAIADLGVDFLAAGIGNIHGKYPANWKGLSFETLAAVQEKTGDLPLVLHGGTGIPADQIKKAISLGVAKINVNTECQLAFAAATRKYIEEGKDEQGKGFDPRKLLAPGAEAIKATVREKIELFGSANKA